MALPAGYGLVPSPPALEEYLRLRAVSGLSPKTPNQVFGAPTESWAWCSVRAAGSTVAMGRVLGDGGWYFLVADMASLPEHQGRGLGAAVLDALLDEIRRAAPAGVCVTLTADSPGRRLSESRGFEEVAPMRQGMHLLLP